jgi:hypothetical protein
VFMATNQRLPDRTVTSNSKDSQDMLDIMCRSTSFPNLPVSSRERVLPNHAIQDYRVSCRPHVHRTIKEAVTADSCVHLPKPKQALTEASRAQMTGDRKTWLF